MNARKAIVLAVAAAAIVAAVIVGGRLASAPSQPADKEAPVQKEQYGSVELNTPIENAQEKGDGTRLDPSQIEGLEKADWLTDSEKTQLVDALESYFWQYGKLNEKKLKIFGDHREVNGIKELFVEDLGDGKKYVCNVGKMFGVHLATEEDLNPQKSPGKSESSESASKSSASAEAQPATEEEIAEINKQDNVSDYTSVETQFDVRKSYPLSMRDKVEPLITKRVADRLMNDINDYIAPSGLSVSKEGNVLVASDKPKTDGEGIMSFRALAYCGNDRLILECMYDTKSDKCGFSLMP